MLLLLLKLSVGDVFATDGLAKVLDAIPENERVSFLRERELTKRERELTKREELKLQQEKEKTKQLQSHPQGRAIATAQVSSSKTPSHIGTEEMNALDSQGDQRTVRFEGSHGDAVLTEEEAATAVLEAQESEKMLDVFMTPFLSHVLGTNGRVLVNCEDFAWVEVMSGHRKLNLKPDFAVAPAGYVVFKDPPHASEGIKQARDESKSALHFGTPLWELRDSVIVLESKKKISSEGFGELLVYLRWICSPTFPTSRGMLFDATEFWLIECVEGVVTKRVISQWTTAGSVQLIRDFFPLSVWERAQVEACIKLGVAVCDDGFLGAGGSGRVFKLKAASARDQHALKVVLSANTYKLQVEHARLQNRKLDCLVTPTTDIAVVEGVGAAYAMAPVGSPVCVSPTNVRDIFNSLKTLHDAKLVHGDARLANVVFHRGKYVWVDVMLSCNSPLEVEIVSDIRTLAASCLKCSETDLPLEVYRHATTKDYAKTALAVGGMLSTASSSSPSSSLPPSSPSGAKRDSHKS